MKKKRSLMLLAKRRRTAIGNTPSARPLTSYPPVKLLGCPGAGLSPPIFPLEMEISNIDCVCPSKFSGDYIAALAKGVWYGGFLFALPHIHVLNYKPKIVSTNILTTVKGKSNAHTLS